MTAQTPGARQPASGASLVPISPQRVRDFCRRTVLSGAATVA